jgi:cell division protein FtsN
MAAKRNNQATRSGAERKQIPAWIWLLAGVLVGLLLAGVVFYKGWAPKLREQQVTPVPAAVKPVEVAPAIESKPKYDFYSVLPEMEVVVPEEEIQSSAAKPAPLPADAAASPQRFVLQAGSFRNNADADALKAKLALLGLRAQVLPVTINGADWFRVRVGPFAELRELDGARQTLQANGISAIPLRDNS